MTGKIENTIKIIHTIKSYKSHIKLKIISRMKTYNTYVVKTSNQFLGSERLNA